MQERSSYGTDPGPRPRDWTCWASALLIVLMFLTVLVCGGIFLSGLGHRHEAVSYLGAGDAISSLPLAGSPSSALMG